MSSKTLDMRPDFELKIGVLNHPNLEEIAQNARALVEKEFTYEKAMERYRKILSDLSSNS